MPEEKDGAGAGVALHLLDRDRQVFLDVVGDAVRHPRAHVPRASVAAKIEVVDVEARAREVVDEAARRQVPGVAVLAETVDEEHGAERPAALPGTPFPHHRQRDGTGGDHDLLPERGRDAAVDDLFDESAVEDQLTLGVSPKLSRL